MPKPQQRPIHALLTDARRTLSLSQSEFGYAVGASHRTAVRWDAGQSTPAPHHLAKLAALLYGKNRELAQEVAVAADRTLEDLGLEKPAPPAGPRFRPEDRAELLVLVAVEESGSAPATVRPWLHAVFARAMELGLTVQEAEAALRAHAAKAPPRTRA